jgi:hypothetical protein
MGCFFWLCWMALRTGKACLSHPFLISVFMAFSFRFVLSKNSLGFLLGFGGCQQFGMLSRVDGIMNLVKEKSSFSRYTSVPAIDFWFYS